MKLTERLKEKFEKVEKVEKVVSKEEAKKTIENVGIILSDDEMNQVAGGAGGFYYDEETVRR
jgi:hypothetical protein